MLGYLVPAYTTGVKRPVFSWLLKRIHENLPNTSYCQNISKQSLFVLILLLIPLVNIVRSVCCFLLKWSSCSGLGDSSNEQMRTAEPPYYPAFVHQNLLI